MNRIMPEKIEISHKTIIFTIILLLAIWLIVQIEEIIFGVFVSFIIMSAIKPSVDRLEKWHIPRVASSLAIYLTLIGVIAFAGSTLIPLIAIQSFNLVESLPEYIKPILPFITIDGQTIVQQIAPISENIFKVTVGFFSNVVTLFTIFIISFYLLIARKNMDNIFTKFLGDNSAKWLTSLVLKIEERLGAWVRGQLTLMITIGVFTYIGLLLLGLPYALPLAIIAGILEIVPFIGPVMSAIPAVLIALATSPLLALAAAALYFIIQQIEGQIVVPFVMRRVVGLPPLVTIISLMVGGKLMGVSGAILAIPIVLTIETMVGEYMRYKDNS